MANKMIKLKSFDGKIFEVEESVAIQSNTIKQLLELDCSDNVIPLQIASNILIKVIEYCRRHSAEAENSEFPESNLNQKQKSSEAENSEFPESNINQKQKSSEAENSEFPESNLKQKQKSSEAESSESPESNLNQKQKSSEAESSESPESKVKINYRQSFFFSDVQSSSIRFFDKEFVKVDWELLMEILNAANYLDIKSLLDLTCQAAADVIKDKSVGQVRTLFNIYNDFTPAEEKKIREEQPWAFE